MQLTCGKISERRAHHFFIGIEQLMVIALENNNTLTNVTVNDTTKSIPKYAEQMLHDPI